jgi:hypothetical protein
LVEEPVKKIVKVPCKKFKGGPPKDEPHKKGKSVVQKLL